MEKPERSTAPDIQRLQSENTNISVPTYKLLYELFDLLSPSDLFSWSLGCLKGLSRTSAGKSLLRIVGNQTILRMCQRPFGMISWRKSNTEGVFILITSKPNKILIVASGCAINFGIHNLVVVVIRVPTVNFLDCSVKMSEDHPPSARAFSTFSVNSQLPQEGGGFCAWHHMYDVGFGSLPVDDASG
ncbi:hypothetical protein HPP92_028788 [Vanilla planifolia]|uniref:Uncharacterized protein n=1 Tax=Vanilla planifolia TaxID=51239 RepID=A0A835P9N2_VANPL|nr:hypothetical protein HPP92_028788 [Vanilla planifolia]KAG0446553.1 hypothetical protein HPP92_028777 [Vanilla planifolia]